MFLLRSPDAKVHHVLSEQEIGMGMEFNWKRLRNPAIRSEHRTNSLDILQTEKSLEFENDLLMGFKQCCMFGLSWAVHLE